MVFGLFVHVFPYIDFREIFMQHILFLRKIDVEPKILCIENML